MSTTVTLTAANNDETLGLALPPFTPHAISVSLPTWRDNVGYEEGDKRVVNAMVSGYPRFFIHLSIEKLARICEQKFGVNGERCLLFPTKKVADHCRAFIIDRSSRSGAVRLVQYLLCPEDTDASASSTTESSAKVLSQQCAELHVVFFPAGAFPVAKQFWQHSGLGISSRFADHCLSLIPESIESPKSPQSPVLPAHTRLPFKANNRHYSVKGAAKLPPTQASDITTSPQSPTLDTSESLTKDQDTYLEERYGRNLPVSAGEFAKRALRRRIAGVLLNDTTNGGESVSDFCAGSQDAEIGPSSRGVSEVTEDDVYLFPTGMSAIWTAHQLALGIRPPAKSVCFGFPYTDTLKILEKWGPGCHFLGRGLDEDIDTLEKILEEESCAPRPPSTPPIAALFTEFPSNPLLRSANLRRIRALADRYDFLIVVDETIGNFVNVEVLPYSDIVVSSLSKVFSGESNVMGGSLVLNPSGRHYDTLKHQLAASYEDTFFMEDAVFMERNSRDFRRRIGVIDTNTEAVCDLLYSRSAVGGHPNPVIKEVFYPKWTTRENFDGCRVKHSTGQPEEKERGFGGLFSLSFMSLAASRTFFDALPCYKGPSLGTNFTLACPYTILAHYTELPWAANYGVDEGLVRISVGLEEKDVLLKGFEIALRAAEAV